MRIPEHPRIVVAVEHTLAGYAALRTAAQLARARGLPLYALLASATAQARDHVAIERAFQQALAGFPRDLHIVTTVVYCSPATALAECASDPQDVIVVGNDGRGPLHALWSAPTAHTLLKHAHCQVLLVPAPEMHRATRRSARALHRHNTDVWTRFETENPRPFSGT